MYRWRRYSRRCFQKVRSHSRCTRLSIPRLTRFPLFFLVVIVLVVGLYTCVRVFVCLPFCSLRCFASLCLSRFLLPSVLLSRDLKLRLYMWFVFRSLALDLSLFSHVLFIHLSRSLSLCLSLALAVFLSLCLCVTFPVAVPFLYFGKFVFLYIFLQMWTAVLRCCQPGWKRRASCFLS